jgi:hypothetical protein
MKFMVLFVLHDIEALNDMLSAWEEVGIKGITILPSTGLARLRQSAALRDDLPLIPSMHDLMDTQESQNRTLVTIVDSEELVDKVVNATQAIVGDLNLPNTGILAVLPVLRVHGLDRKD